MQLTLSEAAFLECFCLQSMTFITQAALNGFLKSIDFTWFMGSGSMIGRGLTFLSETFPSNYTFPERAQIQTLEGQEKIMIVSELVKLGCELSLSRVSKTSLFVMGTQVNLRFAVALAGSVHGGSPVVKIKVLSSRTDLWL